MKTKIHKIDRIRNAFRKLVEGFRDYVKKSNVLDASVLDVSFDSASPIIVWKAAELVLRKQGKLPDDSPILMTTAASIVEGVTVPFIFEDKELVKDILDSDIRSVPFNAVRLPFPEIIIEIPELTEFPDGSGDTWDVACFRSVEYGISKYELNDPRSLLEEKTFDNELTWIVVCYNSQTMKSNWAFIHPKDDYVFSEEDIHGMCPKDDFDKKTVSKSLLQILKLVFFITSPSSIVERVVREKPSKKSPEVVRSGFRVANIVKMTKTRVVYDESEPCGRKMTVRFRVVGHFKHFTKGKLAGRIIWCSPHWRGPDVGVQVEKKYVVER
jgi:hypothetical protein